MAATILVVEDEPAIQELVACNLELAGHRTLRAESAEQALAMVREELPDLIVLYWMLPGINGVELANFCFTLSSCSVFFLQIFKVLNRIIN